MKDKSQLPNPKRIIRISCLIVGIYLLSSFSVYAQEKGSIICTGDKIEFLTEEKTIIGNGNVVITYKEIKITCDKAVIHLDTKQGSLEGNVALYQDGTVFRADRIDYNFQTKKGKLLDCRGEFDPWYGRGKEIIKVSDEEYLITQGYISTCDFDPPHYRIQAKKIRIFLGDKVVAHNVVVYIDKYPVFYIPFYTHSLKDEKPKITITPGHEKDWGIFLLGEYRYWLNDNARGYIHADWRELRGWAGGIDHEYESNRFGEGRLKTYYLDDLDQQVIESVREREQRYRAQYRHRWQIDKNTLFQAEYHKLSDRFVVRDFFEQEYEEENEPESFISFTRSRPDYIINLTATGRVNDFFSQIERLPEISLDVPALKIGSTRFYYQTDTSASNLYNRRAGLSDYEAIRFDSFNQFSYVGKLFNWLYFTPYVGARETWYSEDVNGETLNRAIFYSGISLNTTFWRIFDLETDFLGMEISGLRHLITPGISHNYRYKDPGLEQDKILDFDSIDEITGYNAVTFSLENKLQTKRKFGDETEKFDLADMIMSISYFPGTNKISDLEADLELRPYSWLTCRFDTSYSLDDETVETFNVDLIADGGDKWRFGLGNRYLRNEDNELTAQARYKLSPKWNVRGYQCWGYQGGDVMSTRLVEQEYGIERDLHCWTAELVWNRKDADTIWFVIRLKAFPQIEVKGRATYNEPEIGEHGSGY